MESPPQHTDVKASPEAKAELGLYVETDVEANEDKRLRQTFILPFVVTTFLTLPTLLIIAYSKQTVGYDLLVMNGLYSVIRAVMAVLVTISAVSSLLYVWRGYSHAAKAAVIILEIVVVVGFVYVVWPQ